MLATEKERLKVPQVIEASETSIKFPFDRVRLLEAQNKILGLTH
jgi:hypothetical protein